jgi:plastocyanin
MHRFSFTLTALFAFYAPLAAQTTHPLQSGNLVFIPSVLNIEAGDSIHLTLVADHTLTEVSEETWNANGNTPNGGFNFGPGTPNPGFAHTFSIDTPGTYWFVCIPHAGMGMKCVIHVAPSSVGQRTLDKPSFHLSPNPAVDMLRVLPPQGWEQSELLLMDLSGRTALETRLPEDNTVGITHLPPGVYAVLLRNAHGARALRSTLVIAR